MIDSTPRIITGVFPFQGNGLATPVPLGDAARYGVPADRRAQLVYLRAGNSSAEMISLVLMRDGKPMRMFPIGAKGAVPKSPIVQAITTSWPDMLRVVCMSLMNVIPVVATIFGAAEGCSGQEVLDMGLVEV